MGTALKSLQQMQFVFLVKLLLLVSLSLFFFLFNISAQTFRIVVEFMLRDFGINNNKFASEHPGLKATQRLYATRRKNIFNINT